MSSSADEQDRANGVAQYLDGAEIQAETDAQRAELRRALEDMLRLPASELESRRYAGPDGAPARRSLPELLAAHVVPASPLGLDPTRFYAEVKAPVAQAAIQRTLSANFNP